MASALTTYGKDQFESVFRGVTCTPPANWFLAAFTADPGISGSTASEVSTSGTGYSRKQIAASTGAWDAITTAANNGRLTQNTVAVLFGTATGAWGSVVSLGLMDNSSGGNMWHRWDVSPATTPTAGTTVQVDAGALKIFLDEA